MELLRSFRRHRENIPRPNRRARTSELDRNLAHIGSPTGAAGLRALLLKSLLAQSGKALQCRLFRVAKRMSQCAYRNIRPWPTAADLHFPSRGSISPGLPCAARIRFGSDNGVNREYGLPIPPPAVIHPAISLFDCSRSYKDRDSHFTESSPCCLTAKRGLRPLHGLTPQVLRPEC